MRQTSSYHERLLFELLHDYTIDFLSNSMPFYLKIQMGKNGEIHGDGDGDGEKSDGDGVGTGKIIFKKWGWGRGWGNGHGDGDGDGDNFF